MFKKGMFLVPATILSILFFASAMAQHKNAGREFYEIKLYHFTTPAQEEILDKYLSEAYIPALHKAGIKSIGAFKPLDNDTAANKKLYVLIPLRSMEQWLTLPQQLQKDAGYVNAAKAYTDAAYNAAPYTRMESILLRAFNLAPQSAIPGLKSGKKERVYELRSYESATEKLYWNKVHMFNEGGEIPLFKRLRFNAVFYGEVIAGSRMPNLMYMTSFENMADRDAHWQAFRDDAEWKALSAKQEYKNNVSRNETILTYPAPYSDY
ncbi:NIPSNAP family protein [Agriterribacter sp.]|uniref:NIPSNAP family protein n=1 Tax=Agriterribacter sp. TaxID=2821509 RepID=UPI002C15A4D6|nr:NIPSNAP family protein [Agriterribacter sp.]HRO45432.1 NIPSNAP family protein [Agriterribacter sp.]HRQ19140.1 NIPSNAP family protein [Agriterribacter sp.]